MKSPLLHVLWTASAVSAATIFACSDSEVSPTVDGGIDAPVSVTRKIGPEGGSFTASGVTIDVPQGAVDAATEFSIRSVAAPSLPSNVTLVGSAFELLPSGVSFNKPVKVTLPVPTGVEASQHVLLRLPTGGSEWLPLGAPASSATTVAGYTRSFSTFALVRLLFQDMGCYAPDSCDLTCSSETLSCAGTCSVRNTQAVGAGCDVQQDGRIQCTCSGASSIPPRSAEPLYFDFLDGLMRPQMLLFAIANHCGWPCTGAGGDGGTDAGGGALVQPSCFNYALGTSKAAQISRLADRLYWSVGSGVAAGVHTIKTDLTDYRKFTGHNDVPSIASNSSGVHWVTRTPPQASSVVAGMYELAAPYSAASSPVFIASPIGSVGRVAADDAHVFFTSQSGFTTMLMRADAHGAAPETLVGVAADQLEVVSGYAYWVDSTAVAPSSFCTGGKVMPQIMRVATNAAAPATAEVVLDGCALLSVSGRASEGVVRFATDGASVFAQSDLGEIWKVAASGGTPQRVFQPSFPKKGSWSPMAIVGPNLVFNDQDTSVGASPGLKKIPLAGGPASARFALNYTPTAGTFASDTGALYFADEFNVCKITVP